MKIITLIDNKQSAKQLKCEHGLSFLLQTEDLNILFDVGQSDKFISNANKLGLDLKDVDYVVLSHGHYDHTGGLPSFLEMNTKAKVLMHNNALKQRFSKSSVMVKENAIPWRNNLDKFEGRIQLIDKDIELGNGISILCNIKAQEAYKVVNERLVIKHDEVYIPDSFDDEMMLVAKHDKDVLVLCGCAHTGIVNMLHAVKQRLGFNTITMVAGGLHLNGSDYVQIQHVIEGLKPFNVKRWALNHCTGEQAFECFSQAYPQQVEYCGSGKEIKI